MTSRERRERRDDRQRDDRHDVRDDKHPRDTNDTPTAERSPDEDGRYNDHKKSRRSEDDNDHRQDAVRIIYVPSRRSQENEDDRESNRRPGVDDTGEVRGQTRFQDVGGRQQYASTYGRQNDRRHSDRDHYPDSDSREYSDRRRRHTRDDTDERNNTYFSTAGLIFLIIILVGIGALDMAVEMKSEIRVNRRLSVQLQGDIDRLKNDIKTAIYEVTQKVEGEMNRRHKVCVDSLRELEKDVSEMKGKLGGRNYGIVERADRRTFGESLGGFVQDTVMGAGSVLLSGVRGIINTVFG